MALTAALTIGATLAALELARLWNLPLAATIALAAAFAALPAFWGACRITARIAELHAVLGNALSAFRDGDFGLRLAVRGDRELADLKRLYNELADTVREERRELHHKEVLLDTILQRTPIAVALLNGAGRFVYSNTAARELLAEGARLNGRLLSDLELEEPVQQALQSEAETLFSFADETFHLAQRVFRIDAQPHRLLILERLTPQLRRQEVSVWKKAIRVVNHEINNTVAPISSLFHSVRRAQERPEHRHRLEEIYGLIEERLDRLASFLTSYSEFARLPEPRRERASWSGVLDAARVLYAFRLEGAPALECLMDRRQMEQVVINLVKNAHESGSPSDEIVVSIQRVGDDCVLRVLDRGRGMSEEVMRQALVPFYSTKPDGTGVGLALCNEIVEGHGGRMRLQGREGGGTIVTCWFPGALT